MNRYASPKMKKRILVINASENPVNNYINALNDVFYFRSQCPVDICQLPTSQNAFLKELSSLTHGRYKRHQSSSSMYGLLSYYFLPDMSVRKYMSIPEEDVEKMRVRCSCHGKPIPNDCAHVCTTCLAILCDAKEACHNVISTKQEE